MGFWQKYKNGFLKGAAVTGFIIALAGVGVTAYHRFPAEAEGAQQQGAAQSDENYKQVTVSSSSIKAYIDWDQQDLKLVSSKKDNYFYISDSKMKTWEEVDAKEGIAYIDLSWITKQYDLNIRGDESMNETATLSFKAPRTVKAKYALADGEPKITVTVTETIDKKKTTSEIVLTSSTANSASAASIQWRKGTVGSWQSVDTLDIQKFMTKGATINLRLKGESSSDMSGCQLPSKVASVKITKKAKAPSTKIDPAKLVLGVKKGQEYMVITNTTRTGITSITDKSQASPALKDIPSIEGDGYEKPLEAFSVKIRTAATQKKAASAWNVISYPAQRTVAGNEFTAKLTDDGKVTLTNNTANNIEYFVAETNLINSVKTANITQKTKWTTVKAMKSKSISATTKTVIVSSGTAIFFRYAQEKDNAKTPENEAALPSAVGIVHPTK